MIHQSAGSDPGSRTTPTFSGGGEAPSGSAGRSRTAFRAPGVAIVLAVALVTAGCEASSGTSGRADAGASAPGLSVRMERGWPVMGTFIRVSARAPDSATARQALEAAHGQAVLVDSLMSTYRPSSEISAVNRRAGSGEWTPVSQETLEVVDASLEWARLSDGAFDPTVGPLMRAWGFRGGKPARPSDAELDSVRALVGWRGVEVDREDRRIRLRKEGAALDLGAVAKGYALDRAETAMRKAGARAGMVDLGGNVAVFGPSPRGGGPWVLGIRHPRRKGQLMGTVTTDSGAVSTSGDYEQFFEAGGLRYTHIMDPRTGRPVRGVVSVTVSAARGMTSDILSTLLFVLGPDEGRRFLSEQHPPVHAGVVWVKDPGTGPIRRGLVVVHRDPERGRVEIELPTAADSAN